jgi:hypothetical protein
MIGSGDNPPERRRKMKGAQQEIPQNKAQTNGILGLVLLLGSFLEIDDL